MVAPISSCRMFRKVVAGLPGFRQPWVGFRATANSILLYGSECWSLNSSSRKSLDGTYTRMLPTVLNINWQDHVPNVTLYGDLPRLTDRIAWRRLGIAGHCYRHRELPASQLVLWEVRDGGNIISTLLKSICTISEQLTIKTQTLYPFKPLKPSLPGGPCELKLQPQ